MLRIQEILGFKDSVDMAVIRFDFVVHVPGWDAGPDKKANGYITEQPATT